MGEKDQSSKNEDSREEGRKAAFLKVIEWAKTRLPEGVSVSVEEAEIMAEDAIGQLQQAAADGDDRVREEGRRDGLREAYAVIETYLTNRTERRDDAIEAANKAYDEAARLAAKARALSNETAALGEALDLLTPGEEG